jgi:hypothetical protein
MFDLEREGTADRRRQDVGGCDERNMSDIVTRS